MWAMFSMFHRQKIEQREQFGKLARYGIKHLRRLAALGLAGSNP